MTARTLLSILFISVCLLPILALTVANAYQASLLKAKQIELESMTYALIATFEMDDNQINMPFNVFDDRLNMPQSGYQALIVLNQTVVWQSTSSTTDIAPLALPQPRSGQALFVDQPKGLGDIFVYAFTAEFESENQYIPIKFYVIDNKDTYAKELNTFNQSLLQNGLWVGVLICALLLISLLSVVTPVKQLVQQITQVAKGHTQTDEQLHIQGAYPKELNAIKDSLNHLLISESQQRTRFKHALQDLAHSLKTPLSVLQGDDNIPVASKTPIQQIDQIIQRQLARSVLGKAGWQANTDLRVMIDKTVASMHKIYHHKQLDISINADNKGVLYPIDSADGFSLLGNILDNACKAAHSRIQIDIVDTPQWLQISVCDDGPGIPHQNQLDILERGTRLDSYTHGHGIGLATVNDLVDLYSAKLLIHSPNKYQGTTISVHLPR